MGGVSVIELLNFVIMHRTFIPSFPYHCIGLDLTFDTTANAVILI